MDDTLQIIINKEYEDLVPPLSKEEYDQLKESIRVNGQYLPVILNQNNVLLDGYHRFKICKELGLEVKHKVKHFENKTDEIIFVGECNLQRRQLEPLQRVILVSKLETYYRERAEERQKSGKKSDLRTTLSQGRIRDELGAKANVSGVQYEKGKKIIDSGNEKLIKEVLSGSMTINSAYKDIRKQEKRKERHEALKEIQVNLPDTVQLYNDDFNNVSIKDNSVALIFTDPPYHEKYLHLYDQLGKQAARVLRDGGSLLCYVGHHQIGKIISMMEKHGLDFHWPIAVLHSGPSASVFGLKVLVSYKPILWFTKGKYQGEFVRDVIKSEFQGKELHDWAQSTVESDYYIKYMTIENEIVYDPFMGQGTFGVSAVKQKRQFIGVEINKEHFENAQRVITFANKS